MLFCCYCWCFVVKSTTSLTPLVDFFSFLLPRCHLYIRCVVFVRLVCHTNLLTIKFVFFFEQNLFINSIPQLPMRFENLFFCVSFNICSYLWWFWMKTMDLIERCELYWNMEKRHHSNGSTTWLWLEIGILFSLKCKKPNVNLICTIRYLFLFILDCFYASAPWHVITHTFIKINVRWCFILSVFSLVNFPSTISNKIQLKLPISRENNAG